MTGAAWGGRRAAGVALVWLLLALPAAGQGHPVQARLLVDPAAARPGAALPVGVALRLEPGWHVYWRYSGDAGTPTRVVWDLPAGFAAEPIQWPVPHRYREAGDLTSYGYADSVVLLAPVRLPSNRPDARPVRLLAHVSWLTCKDMCIPGDTTLVLDLPLRRAAPDAGARLAAAAARVPAGLPAGLQLRYGRLDRGGRVSVDLELSGGPITWLDFYPCLDSGLGFSLAPVPDTSPPRLRLSLQPDGGAPVDSLSGVLLYRTAPDGPTQAAAVVLRLRELSPLPGQADVAPATAASVGGPPLALGSYLLLALLGGAILNLMPCVLPVISLKILSFMAQAGEAPGRVRQLGLVFAAGVVTAFVALALGVILVKQGGQQVGWGFQFQYPGFVAAMASLVFALSLSLFGVFTVNVAGAGGLSSLAGREGVAGSFFSGVLATVLATPCTAPFLGTALGFAFAQPAGVVLLVLTTVGVGMALPYALLAWRPGWVRFLPRPGVWMEHFKQLMGFVLMATVLWLLFVLGRQVGADGVVWTLAFLLCVALSCWLVGQWVDLRSSRRRRATAWVLAVVVLLAGYQWCLTPALAGRAEGQPSAMDDGWEPFTQARLDQLLTEGQRPILIDFTAEWCWTCKVYERTVLASPPVRQALAARQFVLLKADWTNRNDEIGAILRSFGRSGVPLYVIYSAGGERPPQVLPEVLTEGILLAAVANAGP
jgi:thiol:disulfide interchange protein DsbD